MTEEFGSPNTIKWQRTADFFSDGENRFLVAFFLDFLLHLFFPFLIDFENDNTLTEKGKVEEKLAEFRIKVDNCTQEVASMFDDENYLHPSNNDCFEQTWLALNLDEECDRASAATFLGTTRMNMKEKECFRTKLKCTKLRMQRNNVMFISNVEDHLFDFGF